MGEKVIFTVYHRYGCEREQGEVVGKGWKYNNGAVGLCAVTVFCYQWWGVGCTVFVQRGSEWSKKSRIIPGLLWFWRIFRFYKHFPKLSLLASMRAIVIIVVDHFDILCQFYTPNYENLLVIALINKNKIWSSNGVVSSAFFEGQVWHMIWSRLILGIQ